MANQESHYQRVKNAFEQYLFIWMDPRRTNEWAEAEINLNGKLNQLGYDDGQAITGQFISLSEKKPYWDLRQNYQPLTDRLGIDFEEMLRNFVVSYEYRGIAILPGFLEAFNVNPARFLAQSHIIFCVIYTPHQARTALELSNGNVAAALRLALAGAVRAQADVGVERRRVRKTRVRNRKMRKMRKTRKN